MGYKEEKLAFVSDLKGSSVIRINSVCATAVTTYLLWTVLSRELSIQASGSSWRTPALEFAILVVPLLLALTSFSARPLLLNISLIILTALANRLNLRPAKPPLSPARSKRNAPQLPQPKSPFNRPFVTVYRAHMMLMTVICILAVDFKVFPREFAKAETWGTSLMDLGVGSFVFSLGLISALPLLKSTARAPFLSAVWVSTKKSAGVLALGVVRVVMVKGIEYPEHVSEYGVHWNFFFTLGLLPIFGAAFQGLSPHFSFTGMALVVTHLHQLLLSRTSLQDWALNAARTTLWSQNKEGLVSLPGYLAIYLIGIGTGLVTLPPDPEFYAILHRIPTRADSADAWHTWAEKRKGIWTAKPGKLGSLLATWTEMWWAYYAITRWFGFEVSRRIANLPYVLWIAAFNTSFIFLYLFIHLVAFPPKREGGSPAIFEAINRNGLVVFLVANLLTGLVNISIESIHASDSLAISVLLLYCAGVVGVAWSLRDKRLRM